MIKNNSFFKFSFSLVLGVFLLGSCSTEKESYSHKLNSVKGLSDGEIYYVATDTFVTNSLTAGEYTYPPVSEMVTIAVKDGNGVSSFTEVPDKYINLDAEVEVSRNVFQDYFPEEWAAMKGTNYTTIYIKSKDDNEVFYMKVVHTNTNTEIGKYSEDF
ncbi:hypothetical protein N8368_00765 [Bacteroidia bacterium]|nr:hypothetical protein [Bacteroidia bacterium]MDB9881803.1 hypothetical protein [Bacteroidia bacterium]MDC1395020.1 hypothetical protein [Bacteroidia bacterium]